jgi:hypothetical protein
MFAAGAMTMLAALVLSFALPEWRIVDPLNATVWACLVGQAVLLVFAQFGFILTTQELPAHVGCFAVHESNCRDASPPRLNRDLHAIDATPARWSGRGGLSPLDSASTAAFSPRKDFVKKLSVHRLTG